MKKVIIEFIIITLFLYLLFKYNIRIKKDIEYIFFYFVKNILPTMFPIIFISNFIKYNILNKYQNKTLRFISLMFSFAPSNAVMSINEKELLYSYNINPLFSFTILQSFFNVKRALVIILINLLINYFFLYKNVSVDNNKAIQNKTFSELIKITMEAIINVFGIAIFFSILINIFGIIIPKYMLFFIEISNGFILLENIKNIFLKKILIIFLNSFCGISIYYQIKSLNDLTSLKLLFKKLILTIIITITTVMILIPL